MAYTPQPRSMVYTATAGATLQIDNGITLAVFNAAALLAVLSVVMPKNPYDGQPLSIIVPKGATFLALSAPAGQTVAGTLPTVAASNAPMRFKYCAPMATWYSN